MDGKLMMKLKLNFCSDSSSSKFNRFTLKTECRQVSKYKKGREIKNNTPRIQHSHIHNADLWFACRIFHEIKINGLFINILCCCFVSRVFFFWSFFFCYCRIFNFREHKLLSFRYTCKIDWFDVKELFHETQSEKPDLCECLRPDSHPSGQYSC